ncbi:MAG: hypothetical protein K6C68_02440 [Ruminococcus sp.]|nr:hypothetical protein [Ruminococcus sp.]
MILQAFQNIGFCLVENSLELFKKVGGRYKDSDKYIEELTICYELIDKLKNAQKGETLLINDKEWLVVEKNTKECYSTLLSLDQFGYDEYINAQ